MSVLVVCLGAIVIAGTAMSAVIRRRRQTPIDRSQLLIEIEKLRAENLLDARLREAFFAMLEAAQADKQS